MILPDINGTGMGQEDDRDKPPYAVNSEVFTQRWYIINADRYRPNMGFYVALVTFEIKTGLGRDSEIRQNAGSQAIQRLDESGHGRKVHWSSLNCPGSTLDQHLTYPLA